MRWLAFLVLCGIAAGQTLTEVYEAGRKKGYEEGFKAGLEKAIEFFREVYVEKLQEYQELETGKLLIKESRVSYPRVYNVHTPDGVQIVVEGCKVIAPVDDLLHRISAVRQSAPPEKSVPNLVLLEKRVKIVLPERALEDVQKVPEVFFFKQGGNLHVYAPERYAKRLCEIYHCEEVER